MPLDGWIPMGGRDEQKDSRGAQRPGRGHHGHHAHQRPCTPCSGDDTRQASVQRRMHGRGRDNRPRHRDVMPGPEHWRRHHWIWMPKAKRWLHLEPAGTREIAPGRVVAFRGKGIPEHVLGRGWPRMHVTPPNFLLHHGAPGLVPVGGPPGVHVVHAPSAHVPGHYGWSPVLHKHVWIGAHTKGPAVAPSSLPPGTRGAFAHMAKLSKDRAVAYAHAHTYWGASGARTSLIPGHWQWSKTKHEWCYIEPHTDTSGRPSTMAYDVAHAPPAAFGPRPSYLPPMHFWPDAEGMMRDVHLRQPVGSSVSITLPPHARYAQQNGLLHPSTTRAVLGASGASGGSSPGTYGTSLALMGIHGAENLSTADQVKAQHYIYNIQAGLSNGDGARAAKYQALLATLARANHTRITYSS